MESNGIFRMLLSCFIGHILLLVINGVGLSGNEIDSNRKLPRNLSFQIRENDEKVKNVCLKFDNITLNVGEPSIVKINSNRITKLTLANNSKTFDLLKTKGIAFWIFEVHTDSLEVIMTLTPDKNQSRNAQEETMSQTMGSNIGIIIQNNQTNNSSKTELPSVYLHNTNECKVKGIVLVRAYKKEDPVPALGTQKRNITGLQPHLNVTWNNYLTTLRFRPAGNLEQYDHEGKPKSNTLVYKYSIYQYWFKEGKFKSDQYIETLSTILLRCDIENKGKLVQDFYQRRNATGAGMVEVSFPTFPGTPQMYAVVVSTSKETYSSSFDDKNNRFVDETGEQDFYSVYIATVSAGCILKIEQPEKKENSINEEPFPKTTGCLTLHYSETNVMVAFCLLMGLFVLFLGHRFFSISQFIYGVLIVGLLAYPIFTAQLHIKPMWILISSIVTGIVGGIITMFFWIYIGNAMFSTVFPAILGGGVLGSVVLYICGCLQEEFLMETGFFYGIFGAVGVVYVGVMITFTRYCHLVSSSLLGGYIVALSLDYFIGSSIKYSLLNILHRSFVPGYADACTQLPFQDYEKLVVSLWVVSTFIGLVFQIWKNRDEPSFPSPFIYLNTNQYRRLNDDNNPGGLNEEGENSIHATEYVSPQNTADTTQLIEQRHPNQRMNNTRSPQLHVTASCPNTTHPNHMIENAGSIEDNRTIEGGEVVGYIQGYGPVTADPNISAAVIRVFQDPRIYEDRPIRASSPRQTASPNVKQGERLHQRFKRTIAKSTSRSQRDNVSEEEVSGSGGVGFDKRSNIRKSKDIFKPPTPESSSPE